MHRWRVKAGLIILLFLSLRTFTLLTAVESVVDPEELYRGTIAKEIIEGLKVPLYNYQADPYDGGSLFMGLGTVPFFVVFGYSLFALKLFPLALSLTTLVLLLLFLKRFFSSSAALWGGLLYTLAPPSFTALSLTTIGSHAESNLFSILLFYSFCAFHRLRSKKWLCLFGFFAGFGFWFTSITLIALASCLLAWYFTARESVSKGKMVSFLGAFTLGSLPWIFYNLAHNFGGVKFLIRAFSSDHSKSGFVSSLIPILSKIGALVVRGIPETACYQDFWMVPGSLISYSYYTVMLLLISKLFKYRNLPYYAALLFYLPVFFLTYGASSFPFHPMGSVIDARYFVPLYFPLLLLSAISLAEMSRLKFYLGGLVLTIGILGQSTLLFREPFAKAFTYKGYSYTQAWPLAQSLFGSSLNFIQMEPSLTKFNPEDRPYIYAAVIPTIPLKEKSFNPESFIKTVESTPEEYRNALLKSFGFLISQKNQGDASRLANYLIPLSENHIRYFYESFYFHSVFISPEPLDALRESLTPEDQNQMHWFYYNVGKLLATPPEENNKWQQAYRISQQASGDQVSWIHRGVGNQIGEYWTLGRIPVTSIRAQLAWQIPPGDRSDLFLGIRWAIVDEFPEDKIRAGDWIARIQKTFRSL